MDCRDETFTFNTPVTDLPDLIGDPAAPSGRTTERICRTIHGPVQATGDGVALARRYAIWGRELETIVGIAKLNDAANVHEVDAALRNVTWNENVIAADSNGDIGYWHPGLHPLRPKRWDERLPYPGDGRAEWRGLLPRRRTPHVINPKQGWLVNWNNPPSDGLDERRRPGARAPHRVAAPRPDPPGAGREGRAKNPSFEASTAIVATSGTTAQQFPFVDRRRLDARRSARAGAGGRDALARAAVLERRATPTRTPPGRSTPASRSGRSSSTSSRRSSCAPTAPAPRRSPAGRAPRISSTSRTASRWR